MPEALPTLTPSALPLITSTVLTEFPLSGLILLVTVVCSVAEDVFTVVVVSVTGLPLLSVVVEVEVVVSLPLTITSPIFTAVSPVTGSVVSLITAPPISTLSTSPLASLLNLILVVISVIASLYCCVNIARGEPL